MTEEIFLSLGSNLGNREQTLNSALKNINNKIGKITARSKIYETQPWNFESNKTFLNITIKLTTKLTATETLEQIKNIEKKHGRNKKTTQNYENRTIDIDIIYYGKQIIKTKNLQIPHKHMHNRNFVLTPLAEIAPDKIHPILKKSTKDLIKICPDKTKIHKTHS